MDWTRGYLHAVVLVSVCCTVTCDMWHEQRVKCLVMVMSTDLVMVMVSGPMLGLRFLKTQARGVNETNKKYTN